MQGLKTLLIGVAMMFAACAPVASAANLPFIQDDFSKARAEAMQRKLPIFVECWAPW